MNILKYYEAKRVNRNTVDLLKDLESSGRACDLPGAIGLHYRKFDKSSPDYSPAYAALEYYDKYHIDLLTCANALQGVYHPLTGDVKVTGATHYCRYKHFCAVCGTKEARRVSSQLGFQFYLNSEFNYDYYMLTLTLPNFEGGFKEGFAIYNKTLSSVLTYCGYIDSQFKKGIYSPCKGYFASREVTYNKKDNTWHPHIHIIMAYEKGAVTDIKLSKKGYVKSGRLNTKRGRIFNVNAVMNAFIQAIHKKFPDFVIPTDSYGNEFLNVDLRPITDLENSVNELCKYLIDYRCFCDSDTLFVYLRDSFRLTKYTKRGCFGWSSEKEELWNRWLDMGRPADKQTLHFMELDNERSIYFGERIGEYLGVRYHFPLYYAREDCIDNLYFYYDKEHDTYRADFYDENIRGLKHVYINMAHLDKIYHEPNKYFNKALLALIHDDQRRSVYLKVVHKKIE